MSHTHSFEKGGVQAWYHEEKDVDGYYHTYDNLCFPGHTPHKVHIFLPRQYESSGVSYPCIYFNDGNTVFWQGGLGNRSWNVSRTLSSLYSSFSLKSQVIVVAIVPNDREYEYTHTAWAPTRPYGGVRQYANYVVEVKQFLDTNYRTLSHPSRTTIIGSSHGGLCAFIVGMMYPERFGIIGAFSPSFWAGVSYVSTLVGLKSLDSSELISHAQIHKTLVSDKRPKVYLTWGLDRIGFHNLFVERWATERGKEMAQLLEKSFNFREGEDLFCFEDKIGGHTEDAWCYQFKLFVQQFY